MIAKLTKELSAALHATSDKRLEVIILPRAEADMERNARWWAEHHSIAQAVGKLNWGRGGKFRTMGPLSGLR